MIEFRSIRYGITSLNSRDSVRDLEIMIKINIKQMVTRKTIARCAVALAVLGVVVYGFEQWGDRSMSRLSTFVAGEGSLGPIVFMIVNVVAIMFLVPQSLFTIAAGVLFGWEMGTVWASVAMTGGAVGSFLIARYGVRDQLRERFENNGVFKKMQRLSLTHPLHVISLSRLIPIIPFPVASYMLGVTQVRSIPYALLTCLCMLPETLFLASGGHLLHLGIVHGRAAWEAAMVFVLAGVALAVLAYRMKNKFLENEDED